MIIEEVKKNGFAVIKSSISEEKISSLIEQFDTFLLLPDAQKKATHFVANKEKGYNLGYYYERNENEYQSNKDFFHYNEILENHLQSIDLSANLIVKDLVVTMKEIFTEIKKLFINSILPDFEVHYPNMSKIFVSSEDTITDNFVLRVVRYKEAEDGDYLIRPHYDRGTCTFIIGDNLPGLRTYHKNESEEIIIDRLCSPDNIVFISGINFKAITHNEVNPLWHDVVQYTDVKTQKTKGRTSVIFFADILSVKMYSYEERYDKNLWTK